jgi:hypothetical protein
MLPTSVILSEPRLGERSRRTPALLVSATLPRGVLVEIDHIENTSLPHCQLELLSGPSTPWIQAAITSTALRMTVIETALLSARLRRAKTQPVNQIVGGIDIAADESEGDNLSFCQQYQRRLVHVQLIAQ